MMQQFTFIIKLSDGYSVVERHFVVDHFVGIFTVRRFFFFKLYTIQLNLLDT